MEDNIPEGPLATVGLLTTLFSSAIASAQTPMHSLSPAVRNNTLALDPGYDDGGGGSMPEWSSLIGIVTALVGNVLISLALNIQRYAHIRIEREWEHEKMLKESQLRQANNAGRYGSDFYGTTAAQGGYRGRGQDQGRNFVPYRDESPDPRDAGYRYRDNDLDCQTAGGGGRDEAHDHRLDQSFLSDRTLKPADQDPRQGRRKSYLRSPYWWAGIVLMTLGEAGNFLAYGFAPASIVSPLGVVALISNCVIAPILLKEKFRRQDLWGVLISIAGAVVVVLSAKSSEEKIGPGDIWFMITQWEFLLYLGLTAALIIVLMWASDKYGSRSILIDVGLVALFGGYTALSTKGVSSLLSFTLWHAITFPITYLLAFILAFSALMQIRYINRALQRFDSTQVIPTQFVLFTLSVIVGSAILYRDFESFTASRAGKFVGGCVMTFVGVYFITSGRVRPDDDSTYSIIEDDEEEAIGLLAGEQIRGSADLSRPEEQQQQLGILHEPAQKVQEPPHRGSLLSSRASLFSVGIEDIDEDQPTPRGVLSPTPSSPTGSLTAESLSAPSPEPWPIVHSQSFLTNPWATSPEQPLTDTNSKLESEIPRPVTPPGESSATPTASTVLLRFPAAPGLGDAPAQNNGTSTNQQAPSQPDANHSHPPAQDVRPPRTPPPTSKSRNSISIRFSPSHLIPTLSTGFSAVVAESLRRGETSPVLKRSHRRRKRSDAVFATDAAEASRGREPGPEPEYDTDASVDDSNNHHTRTATARLLHSTTQGNNTSVTALATAGNATPVFDIPGDGHSKRGASSNTVVTRLRSLSDSWNGRLAWLGGTLRKGNNNRQQRQTISAVERDSGVNPTPSTAAVVEDRTQAQGEGQEEEERGPSS